MIAQEVLEERRRGIMARVSHGIESVCNGYVVVVARLLRISIVSLAVAITVGRVRRSLGKADRP